MRSLFIVAFALLIVGGIAFAGFTVYKRFAFSQTGETFEENIKIGSFTELELDGVLNFHLVQGKKEALDVEASEKILNEIEIDNDGDVLSVRLKGRHFFSKGAEAHVYITVVDLKKLKISGVGNVTVSGLTVGNLEMDIEGVGNKTFDIYCKNLVADIASVGNVTFTGEAKQVEINNSGVGNLSADKFKTQKLILENKGAGNVKVYANKEISIKSYGIGNVKYSGDAEVLEMEINGIGKVKKVS